MNSVIQKSLDTAATIGRDTAAAIGRNTAAAFDGRGAVAKTAARASSALTTGRRAGWASAPVIGAALGVGALGALAYYNIRKTRQDESEHPPIGQFITVDGARLHYIDKGEGDVVTLIHGNFTLAEDFALSGVVDELAKRYRVIVFDRPGFGYSERPNRIWTPDAYAELLQKAFTELGVERVIVVSHSFASLIALEFALQHPSMVEGLVLISGYFYPTPRPDVLFMSIAAIPGLGQLIRYTVAPPLTRLFLPGVLRWLFSPAPVPERFRKGFPSSFAARPPQMQAEASDSVLMVASAAQLEGRYFKLDLPITLVAGKDDKMVNAEWQSIRFHEEVPRSELVILPGVGHMAHHNAPDKVLEAVDQVNSRTSRHASHQSRQTSAAAYHS